MRKPVTSPKSARKAARVAQRQGGYLIATKKTALQKWGRDESTLIGKPPTRGGSGTYVLKTEKSTNKNSAKFSGKAKRRVDL